jgi:glycosyltransferase involved in cell wall biosynthesis
LENQYSDDINEIIVVDNRSTDESIVVAKKYNCKIVTIDEFSYGKAINLGIKEAKNDFVLLLSAHAIPIGNSFFKNSMQFISDKKDFAGLRYINSIENYERAIENKFRVKEPIEFGLMAACCIVSKKVWLQFPFNEELVFSEDKEWSNRVTKAGLSIYEMNESFFYFIKRTTKSDLDRFKNETIAKYQLLNIKSPSDLKIILSFLKKIIITNTIVFFKIISNDYKIAKVKFEINRILNIKKTNINV